MLMKIVKQKEKLQYYRKKMLKREIAYLTLLWSDILDRSNKTSIELKNKHGDALKAVNLLKLLRHYVSSLRDSMRFMKIKSYT